jgi:HEAT repeat protein
MAMAAFLDNEDKEVRQLLVNGIISIDNAESTQVLGQLVQNESDPDIRNQALQALGQRKDEAAAQALLEQAVNDVDEEVKNMDDPSLSQ